MLVASPVTTDPRLYNEAQALVQNGHRVTVIAWDRFKQNPLKDAWDGIDVIRLRICLPPGCGLSVPPWHVFHLLMWQQTACREAMALHKKSPFDAVHCHFLDTMPVGIRLKRGLGITLVYDARDMYGYVMQMSFPRWVARIFECVEKRFVKSADRIIVVCEPMRQLFKNMTERPITTIMNCKSLINLEYQSTHLIKDEFSLIYIGTLHKSRPLTLLIHVMKNLPDVKCIIGGVGEAGYVDYIEKECRDIPNMQFVGRVPSDKVLSLTLKAGVVFCLIDPDNPNFRIAMPNKLFEALVCGRPIICTKGIYSGEFTEREDIGLTVDYNEEALRQAIVKLRDDPTLRERFGRNALDAALKKYNWEQEKKKLIKLYADIRESN